MKLDEDQKIEGIITAKSLTDIYYLLRKSLKEEQTRKTVKTLSKLFTVADTFASDCEMALISEMNDYEEAIMVETAKRIKADCIVTRNIKGYQESSVRIYLPEDLCRFINNN